MVALAAVGMFGGERFSIAASEAEAERLIMISGTIVSFMVDPKQAKTNEDVVSVENYSRPTPHYANRTLSLRTGCLAMDASRSQSSYHQSRDAFADIGDPSDKDTGLEFRSGLLIECWNSIEFGLLCTHWKGYELIQPAMNNHLQASW